MWRDEEREREVRAAHRGRGRRVAGEQRRHRLPRARRRCGWRERRVRGAGVVGEQPVLAPGETFEYTSGTPLSTPSGFMVGSYQMVNEDGKHFSVSVPAFSLDSPHDISLVN